MLDVEYAQLSTSSSRVVSGLCFASTIPKTEEQRRTHGWLFALADDVEGEKNSHGRKAFVLENICSAFRTASSYELHRALLPRLIQQANAKIVQSSSESKVSIALLACALRSDCAVV